MTRVCPEGHESTSQDYCDTCGAPMGTPAPAPDAASGGPARPAEQRPQDAGSALDLPPAEAMQECPNCGLRNRESNLFCEACGYDFTTGVLPQPIALADGSFLDLGRPAAAAESPETVEAPEAPDPPAAAEAPESTETPGPSPGAPRRGEAEPPREPDPPPPGAEGDDPDSPTGSPRPGTEGNDRADGAASSAADGSAESARTGEAGADLDGPGAAPRVDSNRPSRRPRYVPPSRDLGGAWVVEVWVDPEWYAVQDSAEEAPSPSVPDVVPLSSTTALIGRPSASRNLRPDVDCGSDTGVSRRQAALTSDGRRWWIEDLDSANGTYVGPAAGPLPSSPLPPGRRVEIDFDDRIYVGAWTRLVVRRATEAERAGMG